MFVYNPGCPFVLREIEGGTDSLTGEGRTGPLRTNGQPQGEWGTSGVHDQDRGPTDSLRRDRGCEIPASAGMTGGGRDDLLGAIAGSLCTTPAVRSS